jgi:hypothetical protein
MRRQPQEVGQLVHAGNLMTAPVDMQVFTEALALFRPSGSKQNTLFDAIVATIAKQYHAPAPNVASPQRRSRRAWASRYSIGEVTRRYNAEGPNGIVDRRPRAPGARPLLMPEKQEGLLRSPSTPLTRLVCAVSVVRTPRPSHAA